MYECIRISVLLSRKPVANATLYLSRSTFKFNDSYSIRLILIRRLSTSTRREWNKCYATQSSVKALFSSRQCTYCFSYNGLVKAEVSEFKGFFVSIARRRMYVCVWESLYGLHFTKSSIFYFSAIHRIYMYTCAAISKTKKNPLDGCGN